MRRILVGVLAFIAFLWWLLVEQPYEIWLERREAKREAEDALRRKQQAIANTIHLERRK